MGFEPTTPGLKVRDPSDEPGTQAPAAPIRACLPVGEASSDDLPRKQKAALLRPSLRMRCHTISGVERETGIEPATTCFERTIASRRFELSMHLTAMARDHRDILNRGGSMLSSNGCHRNPWFRRHALPPCRSTE